jgi:hypothetical protein
MFQTFQFGIDVEMFFTTGMIRTAENNWNGFLLTFGTIGTFETFGTVAKLL